MKAHTALWLSWLQLSGDSVILRMQCGTQLQKEKHTTDQLFNYVLLGLLLLLLQFPPCPTFRFFSLRFYEFIYLDHLFRLHILLVTLNGTGTIYSI